MVRSFEDRAKSERKRNSPFEERAKSERKSNSPSEEKAKRKRKRNSLQTSVQSKRESNENRLKRIVVAVIPFQLYVAIPTNYGLHLKTVPQSCLSWRNGRIRRPPTQPLEWCHGVFAEKKKTPEIKASLIRSSLDCDSPFQNLNGKDEICQQHFAQYWYCPSIALLNYYSV